MPCDEGEEDGAPPPLEEAVSGRSREGRRCAVLISIKHEANYEMQVEN